MTDTILIIVLCLISAITFAGSHWLTDKFAQKENPFCLKFKPKWLPAILRAIYFLGLPYLTLITGLLPARFFGLKGIEFFLIPDLGQPISSVSGTLFTQAGNILFTWLPDFGPMASTSMVLGAIFVLYLGFYLQAIRPTQTTIYQSKVGIIFDAAHWAFYRAAIWLILGSIYAGFLGGLILVLIEYILANWLRKFPTLLQQQFLLRSSLGLLTSITFLFVPNLWLTLTFHGILVIVSERMLKVFSNPKIVTA
jgi:hypothetical protein